MDSHSWTQVMAKFIGTIAFPPANAPSKPTLTTHENVPLYS